MQGEGRESGWGEARAFRPSATRKENHMKPEIIRADFSPFFSNVAAVEAALALKPFVKPNPRKEGESIMDYTNRLKALRAAEVVG